jgi:Protein of unknown function (DUF3592)
MDLRFIIVAILTLLLMFVAGVLMSRAMPVLLRSLRARDWPETRGVIVQSEVRTLDVRWKNNIGFGYRLATRYAAYVAYEYAVGGLRYRSDRQDLSDEHVLDSEPFKARKVVTRLKQGSVVAVHYNPSRPGIATLNKSAGFAAILQAVLSIAIVAAAGVGAYLALR